MQAPTTSDVGTGMSRARLVAVIVGVSSAIALAWLVLRDPEVDEVAEDGLVDDDGESLDANARAERDHNREARRGRALASRPDARIEREADEVLAPPTAPGGVPGPLGADESRAGFDHVMGRIDELAVARTRLTPDEWEDLYRAANDSFSALSMHLDANDPAELVELEDAHRRLLSSLKRVRVRGRKQVP